MLQLAPQPALKTYQIPLPLPFTIALFLGHYFLSTGLLALWNDLDVKFKLRGVWFLSCTEIYSQFLLVMEAPKDILMNHLG